MHIQYFGKVNVASEFLLEDEVIVRLYTDCGWNKNGEKFLRKIANGINGIQDVAASCDTADHGYVILTITSRSKHKALVKTFIERLFTEAKEIDVYVARAMTEKPRIANERSVFLGTYEDSFGTMESSR